MKKYVPIFILLLVLPLFLKAADPIKGGGRENLLEGLGTTVKNSGLGTANTQMDKKSVADAPAKVPEIIGQIIQIILSFLGVIFLVLMVYGGYLWMTGGGNEEQIAKAKNIMGAAVIGLIIVLAAYAITNTLAALLAERTGIM
ncbi:hypothetical protein A2Y83_01835 [Candidatus Falkowbacteria bacterium RBG_13_39_14]|uniref:TrbC/VIRB2 family protein n=1 Tax=Candidatus Falkowbacteria bacterium RBG_13_39_14 TaxID=1797985 RepID=A0A1F5S2Z3_9BACT|nr:MAG: hypothetical protein A2Y83_01835 [Candidatus Falkowbacteria bacterium RBG_13_39_14]